MRKQKIQNIKKRGQALITLLFLMGVGITVIAASALVIASNVLSSSVSEQGLIAHNGAESGAEDAILHLLRNPSFSGTIPTYQAGDAQVSVVVNSGVITSTGSFGKAIRKIRVQTTFNSGAFSITSWKEIN